jgi:hypothetical protein
VTFYRPADDVLCEVIDGRANLVRPDGGELLRLNPVGTLVWQALPAGGADTDQLVEVVRVQVKGAKPEEIRRDVAEFLDELVTVGLVVRE